jgi:hypothetical protein
VVTDGFAGGKAVAWPRKRERVFNGWKSAGLPWSYKLDKSATDWDYRGDCRKIWYQMTPAR